MCVHIYYVPLVLADHAKYGVVSWYHKCDCIYYVPLVLANYAKYDPS
jgi:hypothetical protein